MVISRKRHPTIPVQPLMVNNTTLERVYSYKYLGIWSTSTLNWSTHVMEVSKKARSQLGIIYRNFYQHSNNATLRQLYLLYIRPIWSMWPWSGTPTKLASSNPLRKCRNFLSGWPPEIGTSTMTPYLEHVIFKSYKLEDTT